MCLHWGQRLSLPASFFPQWTQYLRVTFEGAVLRMIGGVGFLMAWCSPRNIR